VSTTTLFVDLLIIGMQVGALLLLVVLTFLGEQHAGLDKLKGWEGTLGVLALPVVYPLGMFVDNLADFLLDGWRKEIRNKYLRNPSANVSDLLMRAKDDKLAEYFEYLRIRIRISRSTALNFTLIALFFPVFASRYLGGAGMMKWNAGAAVSVASLLLAALALFTWIGVTETYYKKLQRGLEIVDRT